jgi:hypothetical protein
MKKITYQKVGGIHFIKVFRFNFAFSVSRKKTVKAPRVAREPVRSIMREEQILLCH